MSVFGGCAPNARSIVMIWPRWMVEWLTAWVMISHRVKRNSPPSGVRVAIWPTSESLFAASTHSQRPFHTAGHRCFSSSSEGSGGGSPKRRWSPVSTRGGRVHRFAWEPSGEYSRNLALNLPIQGTAAEIAVEALIRIDARLRAELPGKAQLVLQVHDEFIVEVEGTETAVLAAKRIVEQEMVAAFEALLPGAPTKGLVVAHSGPSWAAAKGD